MPLKPRRLTPGDTIGIAAPASAPAHPKAIDLAIEVIEKLGFNPQLASKARKRLGFLAGSDRDRAGDLMRLFRDPAVKAVLCLRGGYGSARLLHLLDYALVKAHPKVFIGYSDITSLHCAFLQKAGLISFHGPMLNSDFVKQDFPEFTWQSFLRTLTNSTPSGSIRQGYEGKTVQVLRKGVASGRLVGGNLSVLCTTLGTPWQPPYKNSILFLEEVDELPYRIDRMLTHLLNAGVLQQVNGIAIGINKNCLDPKASSAAEYRQTVEDVLKDRLLPLRVPIVCGLPFGHQPFNATLPFGLQVKLDANKGDLILCEPAVV